MGAGRSPCSGQGPVTLHVGLQVCLPCRSIKKDTLLINQCLKGHSQIHIIDFKDENIIISKNVLLHQGGEIRHIHTRLPDKGVLGTAYNESSPVFSPTGLDPS